MIISYLMIFELSAYPLSIFQLLIEPSQWDGSFESKKTKQNTA